MSEMERGSIDEPRSSSHGGERAIVATSSDSEKFDRRREAAIDRIATVGGVTTDDYSRRVAQSSTVLFDRRDRDRDRRGGPLPRRRRRLLPATALCTVYYCVT